MGVQFVGVVVFWAFQYLRKIDGLFFFFEASHLDVIYIGYGHNEKMTHSKKFDFELFLTLECFGKNVKRSKLCTLKSPVFFFPLF